MSGGKHDKASLDEYRRKRNFGRTPEPSGEGGDIAGDFFVVQKHAASHLHYDFRLKLHGALKSWALSKAPSYDPDEHRLASHVEDHPLEYAEFEGVIPQGEYGGGTVLLWDRGEWEPLDEGKQGYYRGRLHFNLYGTRMHGAWTLTREGDSSSNKWILTKDRDMFAGKEKLLEETSVASGRTLEEIAAAGQRFWRGGQGLILKKEVTSFGHELGGTLPDFIVPQPATLVDRVPDGDEWLHEIKYDGYRMVCRIDNTGRGVRFYTRKGYDFTDRLGGLREAAGRLPVTQAWIDGEIVVLTETGKSDFHALQNAFLRPSADNLTYFAFDLMNYEGYDIRNVPLVERKSILRDLVTQAAAARIRFLDHVPGEGQAFYQAACRQELEGVVSKLADSEYTSVRGRNWLKVKCSRRQEFVVGGYTESGAGRLFGSLLAGYYDKDGNLVFAGKIKTGYSDTVSRNLIETMRPYEQPDPPFSNPPSGHEYRNPHWLRPELVAEVEFAEITGTGLLRHASFKGLREDKNAREVVLEIPQALAESDLEPEAVLGPEADVEPEPESEPEREPESVPKPEPERERELESDLESGPKPGREQESQPKEVVRPLESSTTGTRGRILTLHPGGKPSRSSTTIVYPHERITREQILQYYSLVADRMLPYLSDRPLTLIVCPTNIYACKFTKHATNLPSPVRAIDVPGHEEKYIAVDSREGLLTLVEKGTIEIHAWQSRFANLEFPDRLLFDLDPPETEGFPWERLGEAALLVRLYLQQYGLESYLQTTGGKGYYVVAPLVPDKGWKTVTPFARRAAEEMEKLYPDRLTAKLEKELRGERIYLDWIRNGRGANAAEPYSLRARPGAPIAVPITWEELVGGVRPDSFTLLNIQDRLDKLKQDPWEGYFTMKQSIPV